MSFFKTVKNLFGYEIEKPKYELVKSLNEIVEIRKYAPSKWVCTSVEGEADKYKSDYQSNMFGKLFNYISGKNDKNERISMTAPVTVVYNTDASEKIKPTSDVKMTMGFFVPSEKQEQTPDPTNKDTFLRNESEMTVAVIRFGGYASMNDYLNYRDQLLQVLGDEAKNYDAINFMTAGYDPPFKPINRTNEVWLRKIQ